MMMLAITTMLIGALLGQRFKVLILLPAIVIGSAAIFAFGMAHSNGLWSILLATAFTITALQLGYLGGSVIRFVIAEARIHKDSARTIAVAQRPAR